MKATHKSALRFCGCFVSALVPLAVVVGSAPAALLSEEHFSYSTAAGSILNQNGGSGWSGPWAPGGFNASIFGNQLVQSGSLGFNRLATSGNRTATAANGSITGLSRSFSTAAQVGTWYLSFLVRPEGTLNAGAFNGFFGIYLDGTNDDLFVGKPGGNVISNYVIEERGGSFQTPTASPVVLNQTALLVVRADLGPAFDSFRLYVNPTPGAPEPTFAAATLNSLDLGTVTGLVLYSTGAHSLDEIRWGETFADVTPVPEPDALPLIAIGGIAVCFARIHCPGRRRRLFT